MCSGRWSDLFCSIQRPPRWLSGEESACDARVVGLILGLGRSPGEGNGNPPQYSCLENPIDRGSWWATVHGAAKSQAQFSNRARTHKEGTAGAFFDLRARVKLSAVLCCPLPKVRLLWGLRRGRGWGARVVLQKGPEDDWKRRGNEKRRLWFGF